MSFVNWRSRRPSAHVSPPRPQNKGKDAWDKVDIVAKLLSSVVLGVVGLFVTISFQRAQLTASRATADGQAAIASAQLEAAKAKGEQDRKLQETSVAAQLLGPLISNDPAQRQIAIIALRHAVAPEVYADVVKVLAKGDPDRDVRKTAIKQLGYSKQSQASGTLAAIATDRSRTPDERVAADFAGQRIVLSGGFPKETYVFAAGQVAYESAESGGGLFTRALVQGLTGKADEDGNGDISANELGHFVSANSSAHSLVDAPIFQATSRNSDAPIFGDSVRARKIIGLVVGVSKYDEPALSMSFAASDARRFSDAMRSLAPQTQLNILIDSDATRRSVEVAMRNLVKESGEGTLLLFYFAGHAATVGGEATLLLSDSRPEMRESGLSLEHIKSTLDTSTASIRCIFIDSCLGPQRLHAER